MIKIVKNKKNIPLIHMEELYDGIDALERIKLDMATQMVEDMPKELFDELFKTTIIDPRNNEQFKLFRDLYAKQPTNYNKARFELFKEAQMRRVVMIEMKTEIETYEEENDKK